MKTVILPGYSPRNKDWALDIQKQMDLDYPYSEDFQEFITK